MTNAIPVTVDEFALVQRHCPIVFTAAEKPTPIALMGLSEGVNVFTNDQGNFLDEEMYIPAYLRRYPFILIRLNEQDDLSLCFDPTAGAVGEFDGGDPLFDEMQPTPTTFAVLKFCEQYESAAHRTEAFVEELLNADLLMDGEVEIQPTDADQPFVYRGFKMIDEEKLKNLPADEVQKLNANGLLFLSHAHLLSLSMIRNVFAAQERTGRSPAR